MSTRSLNKVMLIGNLTRDPNLRYTPNGTAVCSFAIATNRTWTPSDGGEKQEKVEYHNIVSWAKLADICGQLLHKGDKVYLEGRLQTRDWKGDDGQDRRTTEIVLENMMLLSGRGGTYNPAGGNNGGSNRSQAQDEDFEAGTSTESFEATNDDAVSSVEDVADDIPF